MSTGLGLLTTVRTHAVAAATAGPMAAGPSLLRERELAELNVSCTSSTCESVVRAVTGFT